MSNATGDSDDPPVNSGVPHALRTSAASVSDLADSLTAINNALQHALGQTCYNLWQLGNAMEAN
eukprot:12569775-Prorocentrum_lima.AAC.1